MGYTEPHHASSVVDRAGDALIGLISEDEFEDDAHISSSSVINNWRAAHAYPLNTFQMTLRNRTKRVDEHAIVAQRVKRLSSIENKLRRYSQLKLSTIQDIAGARAIVESVPHVYRLVKGYKKRYSNHKLDSERDYIKEPKSDGYRSYHLIYRYNDPKHGSYCDLRVELQIRSLLQHSWATAVETADIFYSEGLKSHRGLPEWHRFFALMGSVLALREGSRPVPRTPRNEIELISELRDCTEKLQVITRFTAFQNTIKVVGEVKQGLKYAILVLNPKAGTTNLYGYRAGALEEATAKLAELERYRTEGSDAVLVSVSDVKNLRRAYPNYFLDTTEFLRALNQAIS
jgi:ppGpp synthetase/RelA/SpoT-type nucleotidyltranferase